MTVQLEDVQGELHAERDRLKLDKVEQSRRQMGVASQMGELQAEAKWSIYTDHVKVTVEGYEKTAESYKAKLSGSDFLTPQEYGELRVKLADTQGLIKGLTLGLTLVTALITQGEKAAQDIAVLTKQ